MNTGIFTGNIGNDAELRTTNGGEVVANFQIGVNVGTHKAKETQWVDCQVWGDRGEKLLPYLVKGTKVTAIGRVKLRTYQKNDGTQGATLQLQVNDIDLHGKREPQHETHDTPKPARKVEIPEDDNPF